MIRFVIPIEEDGVLTVARGIIGAHLYIFRPVFLCAIQVARFDTILAGLFIVIGGINFRTAGKKNGTNNE